ncbi:hypothetical protein SAMN04488544_1625 [Microlunatus sagamiharensis]|uniref:Uncharacterized protein n=1 Tax=Microlunatus sagamiharensis TaxID=546874 RepID=A0A1H2M9F8_9ACTN|nr:hypothetical protein [Microlunatus sagamiharensis]SDU89752.1 hypothetical protein SAMN04488544_1625 [Microlunatus sagamiharensis]
MGIQDKAEDAADRAKDVADDAADRAQDVADDVSGRAKDAADRLGDAAHDARRTASRAADDAVDELQRGHGVVNRLHRLGVRSEWAYVGGFASIGASLASWAISRNKTGDSKAQSDRWGIFIGHWAPTFMALGVALKLEEKR